MTSIGQRLQQDLQAPGNNLLKQALSNQVLDPSEYIQLKKHYAGTNPAQQSEFDAQFANFMEVNFNTAKSTVFGARGVSFPDLQRATHIQVGEARQYLDAGKFWDFEKRYKAATPRVQAEMRIMLNHHFNAVPVNSEKQYSAARDVLASASSRLNPAVISRLRGAIADYEAFTGRGARFVLGPDQVRRCEAVAATRKQPGFPLLRMESRQPVVGKVVVPTDVEDFNRRDEAELLDFLMNSSDPRIADAQGRFEKLVAMPRGGGRPSAIEALTRNILDHPGKNLDPATVLQLALKATDGDYGLAVLSAHNLFKYMAYNARQTAAHPDGAPSKLEDDHVKVMEKLGNLRPDTSQNRDKMGPWYHFFGIQVIAAAYRNAEAGTVSVAAEHFIRLDGIKELRGGLGNAIGRLLGRSVEPSPIDAEKAAVDQASIDLARKLFPFPPR